MNAVGPWRQQLLTDPVPALLSVKDEALLYFVRRDLMNEEVDHVDGLWQLPDVKKLLARQQADGSWPYPGRKVIVYPRHHYGLVETWKQFRFLVEQYELTKRHPSVRKAAEYLFSCQTDDGDIRGMIGNQYATYYTGAIMGLLIKAGYEDDARIEKGFQWLLSMRQDDGGWTIPILTVELDRAAMCRLTSQYAEPVEPDRTKPFSHNWTGMVLRAFAAHHEHRTSVVAETAGTLLKSRFFQRDVYGSYESPSYWLRFQYPFWWNNLLTALETLWYLSFTKDDPDISRGLRWFKDHQDSGGLWRVTYASPREADTPTNRRIKPWVNLAICRMLKRYLD
jgi:hypothetical protein